MNNHFYHGSTKFFTMLKPNSWVTKIQDDARIFAIPTPSKYGLNEEGRPLQIQFGENPPEDCEIFIYKIETKDVRPTESSMGKVLDWNWHTTNWARVELVEYYPSWHRFFGISSKEKEIELDEEFENL